jgi:thiamine biosynthesis lipoprotein
LLRLGAVAGAGLAAPALLSRLAEPARQVASTTGAAGTRLEAARPLLGTWVRIVVHDADAARAQAAVTDAFRAIQKVDDQMSIHRTDSQTARVNHAAGHAAVAVDAAVLDIVGQARDYAARALGTYDPLVLPLMRLFGFYGAPAQGYPGAMAIDRTLALMDWRFLTIDRKAGTLGITKEGAALDLGSIGKGWAIDRAVDALKARGVRSALVDVGGNVFGLGTPDAASEGWSVGVFHPVTSRLERTFVLRDCAVSTSGNTEQSHLLGGIRVGHLFDAKRGCPANGHLLVSIVAKDGVTSDAMSTLAFVLGPDRFRAFPEALSQHFVG